ncbi:hypothetical protein Tco_0858325 [Tanacetum coccineum]|uniref:Uncharacterized protein n=1 Tax=Tanacetum coccineum TaxID=301880 RepID=A0ABQ5BCU4_9ASTR
MPPVLSGDAGVKNGVFTPSGEKQRRILRVGEKREKSPNEKCEGIVIFNIWGKNNLTSPWVKTFIFIKLIKIVYHGRIERNVEGKTLILGNRIIVKYRIFTKGQK